MSAPRRVAIFAIAMGLALGVGAMVGAALSPLRDGGEMEPHGDGNGHAGTDAAHSDAAAGLAVTDGDLTLVPETTALDAGPVQDFRFRIVDRTGNPVRDMDVGHEKLMHLIVVSRDMAHYRHIHPEPQPDGSWTVPLSLPEPGVYRAYADFARAGAPHTLAADLFADGTLRARPLPAPADVATGQGYTATVVTRDDSPGEVDLTYRVATDSGPVESVEPYLGAAAHVVALREGDMAFVHAHADQPAPSSSDLRVAVHAPSAGRYRVFIQFQHDGRVRTVAHTIRVER